MTNTKNKIIRSIKGILPLLALLIICTVAASISINAEEAIVIKGNTGCADPENCSACGLDSCIAPEHDWINATCTDPKTCTICGDTYGHSNGHFMRDATCTEPRTCSACGITEGEPLGHAWTDATCTTHKTCSVCNTTDGETLEHTWNNATCTEPKNCSVCDATEGLLLDHSYTSTVIASTCTAKGYTVHTCSTCTDTYTASPTSALGHVFDNDCDETCNTCDYVRITQGHVYDNVCDTTCNVCSSLRIISHVYSDDGKCTVCGIENKDRSNVGAVLAVFAISAGTVTAVTGVLLIGKHLLFKKED